MKRQESSSNIIHQHSESRLFFLLESIQELHLFSYQSIHLFLVSTMTSKQRKREVQKREIQKQTKLKAAKFAVFAFFDLFDSRLTQNDSEFEVFCEVTNILQQFQQFQHQYRKSNLLDLLHDCLHDFALN